MLYLYTSKQESITLNVTRCESFITELEILFLHIFVPHWCCFPQSCIQRDWPLGTTEPNVKTCGRNHSLCQKCAKVKAYLNRRGEKLDRFGTSLSDNVSERWCLYFSKKWASDCEPSSVALAASTILLKCACCIGAKLVFWQTFLGVIERLQLIFPVEPKKNMDFTALFWGEYFSSHKDWDLVGWARIQPSYLACRWPSHTCQDTQKKKSTLMKKHPNLPICQQPTIGRLGIAVAFPESAWFVFPRKNGV